MCVEISTNHQYNHWGFTDDLATEGKDDGEKSTNFFCLILIVFVLCVKVVAQNVSSHVWRGLLTHGFIAAVVSQMWP